MGEPAGLQDRVRDALAHAVSLEREAVLRHERAAEIHEVLAVEFDRAAGADPDLVQAQRLTRRAEVERSLARLARHSADR